MNITGVPLFIYFLNSPMFNDFLFKKKIKFGFLLLIHPTSAASVKIRELTYKA